jgi:hypothetical protein
MIGPLTTEIYLTTISPSFAFYVIISHTRISVLYHTINTSSGNLIPTVLQPASMKSNKRLGSLYNRLRNPAGPSQRSFWALQTIIATLTEMHDDQHQVKILSTNCERAVPCASNDYNPQVTHSPYPTRHR